MSYLGWKYYADHHPDGFVFMSLWQNDPHALTINGFDLPYQKLVEFDETADMSGKFQIVGSIAPGHRADFSKAVSPHDKDEIRRSGKMLRRPVIGQQVKFPGEDVLRIPDRLQQFTPFIIQALSFDITHAPNTFRKSHATLNIKQWELTGEETDEGNWHVDPLAENSTREKIPVYRAYVASDCAPTEIQGQDPALLRAFDIACITPECWHRQIKFGANDLIGGKRTMAHLAVYTLEHNF